MLSLAIIATVATPVGLYPSPRLATLIGAILGVVGCSVVAASATAMAALVVLVGAVVMSGPSSAPTAPGYLDRAVEVLSPETTPEPAALTAPVVTVDGAEYARLSAEADRLLACYSRALSSRHRTRAAGYWARYREALIALDATIDV